MRGSRATLFVLNGEIAHALTVPVLGELGGSLFVARDLVFSNPPYIPSAAIESLAYRMYFDNDKLPFVLW